MLRASELCYSIRATDESCLVLSDRQREPGYWRQSAPSHGIATPANNARVAQQHGMVSCHEQSVCSCHEQSVCAITFSTQCKSNHVLQTVAVGSRCRLTLRIARLLMGATAKNTDGIPQFRSHEATKHHDPTTIVLSRSATRIWFCVE